MSVNAYGWRLKALARAVSDAGGEPVSDTALALQLLRGVTPRLRVMGTSLLVNDRFPSFMEALSWLHLEEYRREQGEF